MFGIIADVFIYSSAKALMHLYNELEEKRHLERKVRELTLIVNNKST